MFRCVASDRPPAPGYATMNNGLCTSPRLSLLPPAWGRDPGLQFLPPSPVPFALLFSSHFFLPSKSRAAVADHSCKRMPGWTITVFRSFPNRSKAFPGGRSCKGRSKLGMGFEPATISERPYDQSG